MPRNLIPNHMKAEILCFKDLLITGAEVTFIGSSIFAFDLPKQTSVLLIKLLAQEGATITFYTSSIHVQLNRKDITNYTLYREEE